MTKNTKGPLAELGAAIAAQERELELRDPETGYIREIPAEFLAYMPRGMRRIRRLPVNDQYDLFHDKSYSLYECLQLMKGHSESVLFPETEEAAMSLVRHGAAAYFALQERPDDGDAQMLCDIIYGQLAIAEQEK